MSLRLFAPSSRQGGAPTRHASPLRFGSPNLRLAALIPALLLSTPSLARDYATRDVGPWVVSASSDRKGCFLTRTYDGPRATTVQFGLDADGTNRLTVLNANWSIQAKEQLRLTFRLSNASFPRHLSIGIATEGKRGFVTSFGVNFPTALAASNFLHIRRGDVPVEELTLDGSGAAIAELRKCVDLYRNAPAARPAAKAEKGRIPTDPFAIKTKSESRK